MSACSGVWSNYLSVQICSISTIILVSLEISYLNLLLCELETLVMPCRVVFMKYTLNADYCSIYHHGFIINGFKTFLTLDWHNVLAYNALYIIN